MLRSILAVLAAITAMLTIAPAAMADDLTWDVPSHAQAGSTLSGRLSNTSAAKVETFELLPARGTATSQRDVTAEVSYNPATGDIRWTVPASQTTGMFMLRARTSLEIKDVALTVNAAPAPSPLPTSPIGSDQPQTSTPTSPNVSSVPAPAAPAADKVDDDDAQAAGLTVNTPTSRGAGDQVLCDRITSVMWKPGKQETRYTKVSGNGRTVSTIARKAKGKNFTRPSARFVGTAKGKSGCKVKYRIGKRGALRDVSMRPNVRFTERSFIGSPTVTIYVVAKKNTVKLQLNRR